MRVIKTLRDALTWELQCLYNAEKQVKDKIDMIQSKITSKTLKATLKKYAESTGNKRVKIDRMFSYLSREPKPRINKVMEKLLREAQLQIGPRVSNNMKTLVLISAFQYTIQYKVSAYKTALYYALNLELDTVADLLKQIIEWEIKTDAALKDLTQKEFGNSNAAIWN